MNSHFRTEEEGVLAAFAFKAMNTTVSCTLSCGSKEQAEQLEQVVVSWFSYAEDRFSRFRPASELVHLNDRAGAECLVSSAMLEVLRLAETYRKQTKGAFTPFILDALQRAGYNRSFERLAASTTGCAADLPQAERLAGHAAQTPAIQINSFMQSVNFPTGASIDLGGIVKSWSVKRLAAWLRRKHGVARGLLNAGGDLAVWGGGPGASAVRSSGISDAAAPLWRIGIEHPWTDGGTIGLLVLGEGALATSSTIGRRWTHAGEMMHHLIDPVTMRSSVSDIVQCTTSGSDPVTCEVWAKTLCILGSEAGLALLARTKPPIEALLFGRNRDILFYGDPASLGKKWINVPVTRAVPVFDKLNSFPDWRDSLD